jgi:fatty acid desaturase
MNALNGMDERAASTLYGALRRELGSRGVFEADTRAYVLRCCWLVPAYFGGWLALQRWEGAGPRLLMAAVVAFASVQAAAIGHEAGHGAVSRSKGVTDLVGQVFMSFFMGNSYASWVYRHGRHHAHSNSHLDPDIRPGLFSFNEADARRRRGLPRLFTCYQHLLIWPLCTLMAFSLKGNGWVFALRNRESARMDVWVLALHALLWLVLPAWLRGPGAAVGDYLLITWLEGIHLAFIFLTNHLGRPSSDGLEEASFLHRQILTARNLPDSWLLARICNGLNSHIEHHLFGNVSLSKLSLARAVTRKLCQEHGITYHEVGVLRAFWEFHQHNRRMALVARAAAPAVAERESPVKVG